MQAVRGDYKSRVPSELRSLELKPTKLNLTGENKMRRAQLEVFLLSVAIATAMATSYEQTGDCGVSGY